MTPTDLRQRADSVSFRQLKLFESIGRLSSVRKASEECNLSQPAVTQALAKLEQQIGLTLVDRRASGSYLNEYGALFYARIARFFGQVEDAMAMLGVPGGAAGAQLAARRLSRSQIRALIAIADHKSFAQAARSLDLSQASLQRATRDLEANLRKPLFYRAAEGIMVTPQGSEFGRRMKLALQEIEWGIKEMDAAKGGHAAEIVIGALPSGGTVLVGAAIEDFVRAHPQADIRIMNENTSVMLTTLGKGDVDLVVGLLPKAHNPELTCEALAATPYSIVARRGHPLLRKGRITRDDLLGYDWIVGTSGSSRRACFDQIFAGGPLPSAPIKTCAMAVIRPLLADSDRLTLMTSYELLHQKNDFVTIPFGPIALVPEIGVTMRADWLPTRLHRDFIDFLRRHTELLTAREPLRQVG